MAKITVEQTFNGFDRVLDRFGLRADWDEMLAFLRAIELRVREERDANSAAEVRRLIDAAFKAHADQGWAPGKQGGIDWIKTVTRARVEFRLGIEVQVSARSDMVAVDLIHLAEAFRLGNLDIGAILVPTDRLGHFLTDRAPTLRETKRHLELVAEIIQNRPAALLSIGHDGPGPALPKRRKAPVGSRERKRRS